MKTLDVFSTSVKYKFKTRYCSIASLVVFLLTIVAIILPLIIAFQANGFWLKNRMYVETPSVKFMHKYLFIAERDFKTIPIICSTYKVYQKNPIADDCILVKVREIDINNDRQKDILKFEAQFYSDRPIRSLKLLLFFQFELKDIIHKTITSLAVFDYTLPHDVQKIHMIGDLKLNQKGMIKHDDFIQTPNETVELTDHSLNEVLSYNARQQFSAQIINTHVTWKTGFSNDESITITGEIFYLEQLLYYQPGIWEELKWAWIQYLSILIAIAYIIKQLLKFLFTKNYLQSYIVLPWNKNK
ncbi:hypothetical protein PV327_005099 [Microctonus hyperodae]|uniref:Transmembrane protein 231 n=1 Tax=Microctonus hyperodae TaxID=165561 RepID=A0AA39G0P4_MICHY|nr:hypothetical protein PV327_005099 [Microctonus hyperodae]